LNSLFIVFNKATKKYEFLPDKNKKKKILAESLENFNLNKS